MQTQIPELAASLLGSIQLQTSATEAGTATYASTADKAYDNLLMYGNVTSYSQLQILHSCPRKYQLVMHRASKPFSRMEVLPNLDFCFGHAVGAGVQNWLLTKDIELAQFNASMAWRAPFTERWDKKKKSLWEAMLGIELFVEWWTNSGFAEEWELCILPSGKPAIELSFSLHARNEFKHYGHIDIVLTNRYSGQVAVLELKTTGLGPEEALYANSSQATGYSVMLDAIFPGLNEYTVLYAVYSVKDREWSMMPFDKSLLARAEWIKDLLLDHSSLTTYEQIHFYPKRGESCYSFMRRCEFFGECNLTPDVGETLPKLEENKEAEKVDFVIELDSIIEQLQKDAQS
jgi:hypothetical protein